MSRLQDLINELCPHGVEYKEIQEVSKTVSPRGKIKSSDYLDKGKYPVIDQGQSYIGGYTNEEVAFSNGEYVIFGDHTCVVKFVNFQFTQGADGVKVISAESDVLPKFLYYCMSNIYMVADYSRHWSKMKVEKIPLPPLPVQHEIVRILDNFTELTAELKEKLTTELTARKKQYEYYRDSLLSFGDNVEYKTLPEISENCDRQRKPVTKGNRQAGEYPYYGASGIVDYVADYIFDGDYLLVSEDGANLLARSTPISFPISGKNWVNNHAHVLKFDFAELQKYVEIYLNSIDLSKYISGGAQPKLNQDNLNKIPIPVPSDDDVKRIVGVLTRFDTLCNDLTGGLPAEIEARQKQYEYYRDKLLTFRPLEKGEMQ